MSGPLFSVVIPTYDRPDLVAEAVESVLAQTVDDLECIVIDDAGPRRYQPPSDERVRVIRLEENAGPAVTRNVGIDEARGANIAFLDDDDVWTRDRLEMAVEGLRTAPVAVCWTRWIDGPENPNRRLDGDVGDQIASGLTPQLGATAVRREALLRFDERFDACQDIDWWLRVALVHPVATVARYGHLMRRHDGPRNRNALEVRAHYMRLLMEVHDPYFAVHRDAAAFRLRRVAQVELGLGRPTPARSALLRSLRARPTTGAVADLVRTFAPRR